MREMEVPRLWCWRVRDRSGYRLKSPPRIALQFQLGRSVVRRSRPGDSNSEAREAWHPRHSLRGSQSGLTDLRSGSPHLNGTMRHEPPRLPNVALYYPGARCTLSNGRGIIIYRKKIPKIRTSLDITRHAGRQQVRSTTCNYSVAVFVSMALTLTVGDDHHWHVGGQVFAFYSQNLPANDDPCHLIRKSSGAVRK